MRDTGRSRRCGAGRANLIALALMVTTPAAAGEMDYRNALPASPHRVIDVRPLAECVAATLRDARCVPIVDILGPQRRLPNASGLLWLLGTAGLDGSEHAVVAGRGDRDVEFVAGLLYLAGQRQVSVLIPAIADLPAQEAVLAPGIGRSMTREVVFQGQMRAERILLRAELMALIGGTSPPLLIDVRSEADYWGERVRAARGGHLPGAQSSPLEGWQPAQAGGPPIELAAAAQPVIYGHDHYDGVIGFTRVAAMTAAAPRVYLEGWVAWALDGALPADAVTFVPRAEGAMLTPLSARSITVLTLAAMALAGIGFVAGRMSGRRARA